jgi:hypothetical protein
MSTGASVSSLPTKLGLTGEIVFTVRRAPDHFAALLSADGGLGDAVWQQSLMPPLDVVIGFYAHRVVLAADWPKLAAPLSPDGVVWIAWPKRSSDVETDLTEDVVRAQVLPTGWVDTKVCTIDETWSALRFVKPPETRRPKDNTRSAKARKR